MPTSRLMHWILCCLLALSAVGCAGTSPDQGAQTGSLSLDLVLASSVQIDEVDWQITGNGMDMSGSIDVSAPGSTASVEVFGLPPGDEPYIVELTAISVDKEVTCRGSAEFDVEVGVSTEVMVILNCKLPQQYGGVRVNGEFNICAQLTKMVVSPLQTSVGNDITLFSSATDEEGDPITTLWSSGSGVIADPAATSTTYTCTEVGDDEITVLVSDDDGAYCMSMWTVAVTCVEGEGNPCDGVTCEDDGNECTSEACNVGNGQCESTPVDEGTDCDSGAGMCMSGECVPSDLCTGVVCEDDGNECTSELCNPETGQCETSNVDDGTSCDDATGMCMNGECISTDLCMDVVCEDDGNECTAAECNPSTGQCETTNVPDGTVCAGGPVELTVNGGFETGDLDGWTQFCEGDNNGSCAATMAQAESGSWSGNLVASVPAEGGAPSFPLIKNANIGVGTVMPNSTVSISFDLLGSLTGAGGVVFAEFFSELAGGGTSSSVILGGGPLFPTGEWVNYTFTTTTGPDVSGGVTVQLKADCGANAGCVVDAYFDNVSVTIESSGGICMEGVCGTVDPCDGVVCDDTGNECTTSACNSANGLCETSNVADGTPCNDDTGTCSAGLCEEPSEEALYTQSFEALDPESATALSGDGWLYFGNVFNSTGAFKFGFGPFVAPTTSGQISVIATGEGGPEQGNNQLVVFSNYDCCQPGEGHFGTDLVETIVFQEINPIPGDFIGRVLTFQFEAKRGNIGGATTAQAFVRTLDPGAGFATTNNIVLDTTNLPTDWATYSITLNLSDPLLQGQILQFGFSTVASNFESAGNFYDNIVADLSPTP